MPLTTIKTNKKDDGAVTSFETKRVEDVCILTIRSYHKIGGFYDTIMQKELLIPEEQYHKELRILAEKHNTYIKELSTNPEWDQ